MPTILDSIGAVNPAGINGVSLSLALQGKSMQPRTMVLSEGGVAKHNSSTMPGAVIAPPWSLLMQRRGCGDGPSSMGPNGQMPTCLFNIAEDPGQHHNVASQYPNVVNELKSRWNSFRSASHDANTVKLSLSQSFIDELRKNGYDFHQQ